MCSNRTYYTSLSGMVAANYGLQNTSNNIANMQSKGFKRSEVFYASLNHGSEHNFLGGGVAVGGHTLNFEQGNYLNTDNPADLAIVGQGFFIIKLKNGELRYSRDGEFTFNKQGLLIDKLSGGLVQGYNSQGALVSINQFGAKQSLGKPTHLINLAGEWIIIELEKDPNKPEDPSPFKSKFETVQFNVAEVFDAQGKAHTIHLTFESPSMPGSGKNPFENLKWDLLSATCDDAALTFTPQSLEFDSDVSGSPTHNSNTIHLTLNGNQPLTLNFGEPLSDQSSSVRLYKKNSADHTQTNIAIHDHDGYGLGKQIGFSFDDNGQITYQYDNGQSEEGIHVALALFQDMEHTLVQTDNQQFYAKQTHGLKIGRPNKHGFGTIQSKKLEGANVDTTIEFGNIVVLQRMFQACSQLMDIDKQLLEWLCEK
jgi:flagellar hook protein FlgE